MGGVIELNPDCMLYETYQKSYQDMRSVIGGNGSGMRFEKSETLMSWLVGPRLKKTVFLLAMSLAVSIPCGGSLSAAEAQSSDPTELPLELKSTDVKRSDAIPGDVTPAAVDVKPGGAPMEVKTLEVKPAEPEKVFEPRDIRPLPGGLNSVPMFNSNNPEIVLSEGILLSTFPSADGPAHLNYSFDGRFDIFAHHIADGKKSGHLEDLNLGLIVGNVGEKPVSVQVLDAATYNSQPDAPFITLEPLVNNDDGKVYAGPGDRVMNDILRDAKTEGWKSKITVRPGAKVLLKSIPLHVDSLPSKVNGRSLLARLKSNGPVRLALVAKFSALESEGVFREPTQEEFITVLDAGKFVEPRDPAPTRPEDKGAIRYGRVAGVQIGSEWKTKVTDKGSTHLALPSPSLPISYPISALAAGTFGTGQVQSAPLVVRNEGTAYQAHGNYGVKYDLTFPLKNTTDKNLKVDVSLETPLKSDEKKSEVAFYRTTDRRVFFRGTIKIGSGKGKKVSKSHYQHVVEHRGEKVGALLSLVVPKNGSRTVEVELLYPPDCTPPQMLTLSTSSDVE